MRGRRFGGSLLAVSFLGDSQYPSGNDATILCVLYLLAENAYNVDMEAVKTTTPEIMETLQREIQTVVFAARDKTGLPQTCAIDAGRCLHRAAVSASAR